MKFRKANQRDVESLQTFTSNSSDKTTLFGHSLGREFFKSIIRTGLVYIAETDKKEMQGYLVAEADARIQFSNIVHMLIHPEACKESIVSGLLNKHYEECKKMNISDIAMHTAKNQDVDMLSSMGFSTEKEFVMLTRQVDGFN